MLITMLIKIKTRILATFFYELLVFYTFKKYNKFN